MEIKIVQQTLDLYGATFVIVSQSGDVLGNISFNGNMGSMEGVFDIRYQNDYIRMTPTSVKDATNIGKNFVDCSLFRKPYRPYRIELNGRPGIIFHHQVKNMSYRFLNLDNDTLFLYVLGFGEKGICAPIYRGENCIAEIHKDIIIHDGLQVFNLFFSDYSDVIKEIIYCCHAYVMSYYQPGVKIKKGISKRVYTTTDKQMLSMCKNPYYL